MYLQRDDVGCSLAELVSFLIGSYQKRGWTVLSFKDRLLHVGKGRSLQKTRIF